MFVTNIMITDDYLFKLKKSRDIINRRMNPIENYLRSKEKNLRTTENINLPQNIKNEIKEKLATNSILENHKQQLQNISHLPNNQQNLYKQYVMGGQKKRKTKKRKTKKRKTKKHRKHSK